MDTRYWGPSGWKLLHLIASAQRPCKQFWTVLPYVLPCKFCRTSLSTYYEALPVPNNPKEYPVWIWKIHNQVNDKLRSQGQTIPPDPSFESVEKRYNELLQQDCTKTFFDTWGFLFCIADNHPGSSPSAPMKDIPEKRISKMSDDEKNKYNILPVGIRKAKLRIFWKTLGDALPYKEWRDAWKKHAGPLFQATQQRKNALSWLWKIRKGMEQELQIIDMTDFHGLCKAVAQHRSGCATSKRARTCRRRNNSPMRNTRKNHV